MQKQDYYSNYYNNQFNQTPNLRQNSNSGNINPAQNQHNPNFYPKEAFNHTDKRPLQSNQTNLKAESKNQNPLIVISFPTKPDKLIHEAVKKPNKVFNPIQTQQRFNPNPNKTNFLSGNNILATSPSNPQILEEINRRLQSKKTQRQDEFLQTFTQNNRNSPTLTNQIYQDIDNSKKPFYLNFSSGFSTEKLFGKKLKVGKKGKLKKFVTAAVLLVLLGTGVNFSLGKFSQNPASAKASQNENIIKPDQIAANNPEYDKWIKEKNYTFSAAYEDLDTDGLTNLEEFYLDTNPLSANTCSKDSSDSENLFTFINPKTCKSIDPNNQEEIGRIEKVVSKDKINEIIASSTSSTETNKEPGKTSLLNLFGVSKLEELDKISGDNIQKEIENKDIKLQYLNQIVRIEKYIAKNRSYEPLDRDYSVPVHGAKYLETSLQCNIPVKYIMAIARVESRFGTDRYTANGNLTRPGEHKNIFSLGLTDSGSNLTFTDWNGGFDLLCKWWKKFDDRGVSVERRLKIYNPNGDYPGKIEGIANEIDRFLNA